MARMQGVSPEQMTPRQRGIAEEIAKGPRGRVGSLMQLWLHSPDVAEHAQRLGAYFRVQDNLPPHAVEMVILLTARAWRCAYEWVQHEPHARAKGLKHGIIEAIRRGGRPDFEDAALAAVYDYTKATLTEHAVPDAVFTRVKDAFGPRGIVDLSVLIGHYIHGAILLNAVQVARPAGTEDPFSVVD